MWPARPLVEPVVRLGGARVVHGVGRMRRRDCRAGLTENGAPKRPVPVNWSVRAAQWCFFFFFLPFTVKW